MRPILGTPEFGARINKDVATKIVSTFVRLCKGDKVCIDAAHASPDSEKCLGTIQEAHQENVMLTTKASPWFGCNLTRKGIRLQMESSLENLKVSKVDFFYLHSPDHSTPIIETLEAVNDLYEEGKFDMFGLSNYAAWQVAEICTICENNSWVKPTICQGMYNCLTRQVEKELFPCLRHYGISFVAYNTLAYGLLSGKYRFSDGDSSQLQGKFSIDHIWATHNKERYWKEKNFTSISEIQVILNKVYGVNKVSLPEASLRWLCHHSSLDASRGDGILLGVSTLEQLTSNLDALDAGPLDENVVKAIEKGWERICGDCPNYMK